MKRVCGVIKKKGSFRYGPRSTSAVWDDRLKAAFEAWKNTHKVEKPAPSASTSKPAAVDILKKQAAIKKSFASQSEVSFSKGAQPAPPAVPPAPPKPSFMSGENAKDLAKVGAYGALAGYALRKREVPWLMKAAGGYGLLKALGAGGRVIKRVSNK